MEGSPVVVKKEKSITFQNKVYLLDCHSFLSFLLSFQINVSEDSALLLQGFKGSMKETNKMLPSSTLSSV